MTVDKLKIVMDEAKIRRERKYDYAKIMDALDKRFVEKLGMIKEAEGVYVGSGSSRDFAKFGRATLDLSRCDWFAENLDSMEYFEVNEEDPEWNVQEDWKTGIIEKRRKIA